MIDEVQRIEPIISKPIKSENNPLSVVMFVYGLFYDQGIRSVSFEVKNDVFQICFTADL